MVGGKKVASTTVMSFFERFCLPQDQEETHVPKCESPLITTKAGFIGPRPSEKGLTPVEVNDSGKQGTLRCPKGMNIADFANSIPPTYSHVPLSKLLNLPYVNLLFKQLKTYYKFTVVRNPWDVQVSMFHYVVKKSGEPFGNFVKRLCTVNSDVYSLNGKPACDFYIRYENLENDMRTVCNTLGLPFDKYHVPNHRAKQTSRVDRDYRKYYTDELRDFVAMKCAVEIEMFGYTF
jgi:hypothetical protein